MIKIIDRIIGDISNIACYNKRNENPKLHYIDLFFSTIPENIEIIGFADCSLYHQIDDKIRYKNEYLIQKKIIEAPAHFRADGFILTYALENNISIISNDQFKTYSFVSQEWLGSHRIGFMIINKQLIFEKPIYLMFNELNELKNKNNKSEINIKIMGEN